MVTVIDDLSFAHGLADLADEITSTEFKTKRYTVRSKDDGSAVTDVDVRVEEALARQVATAHPEDAFLGEELGRSRTPVGARRTWIVDGIDGTGAFIQGGSTWGTLIALQQDGEVLVGVASSPGLTRRWWAARGSGAWSADLGSGGDASEPVRLSVSGRIHRARGVVLPPVGLLDGWRDAAVRRAVDFLRPTGPPGHGPILVASGELDASVHLWGGPWDHAPFVVLVEEAGGQFSDLWGGQRIDTATAVFSNRLVHQRVRVHVVASAPSHPDLSPDTP